MVSLPEHMSAERAQGPLYGLAFERRGSGPAALIAAWLLAGLGAAPAATASGMEGTGAPAMAGPGSGRPGVAAELLLGEADGAARGSGCGVGSGHGCGRLVRAAGPLPEAALPPGTLDYSSGLALASAALAGLRCGTPVEVDETAVAVQVLLPEVMAAAYHSPSGIAAPRPRAAPGGGWVHADLGSPGDEDTFELLLGVVGPAATAGEVAAAAQEWRLPVCDYRPRSPGPVVHPVRIEPGTGASGAGTAGPRRPATAAWGGAPLAGVRVCDLTAMWAGPLATWLLAGLGADVIKVEPAFRPDGTRAIDGRGIHPGGRQVDPGCDSAMWNSLNAGKVVVDWDLRRPDDLARLVDLASGSDLLVESFSPRVIPNFGLDRILTGGRPAWVAMPAFPPGPRRNWSAYGSGIHALLGLGGGASPPGSGGRTIAPPGLPAAAGVSYPDPLNGFTGALAALAALTGRDRGRPVARTEATLYGSARPLLAWPAAGTGRGRSGGGHPPSSTAAPIGSRLLEMASAAGLMEARPVAGIGLAHPRHTFRVAST